MTAQNGIDPIEAILEELDAMQAPAAQAASGRALTQFKPGNPGRPRGSRNKRTRMVEALLDGELEALTKRVILKAMSGDMTALRICLDRAAPPAKEAPITLDLPPLHTADDVAEASTKVMTAVVAGELTLTEGSRMMTLLGHHMANLDPGEPECDDAPAEERQG